MIQYLTLLETELKSPTLPTGAPIGQLGPPVLHSVWSILPSSVFQLHRVSAIAPLSSQRPFPAFQVLILVGTPIGRKRTLDFGFHRN